MNKEKGKNDPMRYLAVQVRALQNGPGTMQKARGKKGRAVGWRAKLPGRQTTCAK